ncbi:hypothetical protein [Gimesia aquarii]|uniref:VWFA domain-containing protein n=1 Tax=Gimesia aquarii TaxID=2527964 RepID=A0A517WRU7_9PLAN|nr:hypothetical protein [Gimesia aquarii]QDU07981.1 hypothetical protein V202x_13430 [Gimesia aquarii]
MNRLITLILLMFPTFAYAEPQAVMQFLDLPYVKMEDFSSDLGSHSNYQLPVRERVKEYMKFLKEVEAVQDQQKIVFRMLIKKHNLKEIYVQKLTEKNYKETMMFIEKLKAYEKNKNPEDYFAVAQNKIDLLKLGAAGQLVVSGELEAIRPADDSKALEATNLIGPDGKVISDKKANEAREDAIVKNLLNSDSLTAVIILNSDHDLSDNLKRLANVRRYEQFAVPKYKEAINRRNAKSIIHIMNFHYISQEVYTADLKDQSDKLTDEQIDEKYINYLNNIEEIQKQQKKILRALIKEHKLKAIYVEGLTEKNYKSVLKNIKFMKTIKSQLSEEEYRLNMLSYGAAAQLVLSGELETLLPVDNKKLMDEFNPIKPDGSVGYDKKANEKREDAIVEKLLEGDRVVVIVLGGAHDLSDNIKRLAKGTKYKQISVPKYIEMDKLSGPVNFQ